jgi:hypothetical protein
VYKIIQQTEKGNATFLNVAFPFVCPERDLPQGSYIIASQKFIEKTVSKFLSEELGRSGPFKASECAGFIRQHGLHELFRRLITNPDGIAANWSFNRLIGASRQFHILRPIRIDTDELQFAISKFLQVLSLCGLKPVSADDLRERTRQEGKGLVSCSCELYLQAVSKQTQAANLQIVYRQHRQAPSSEMRSECIGTVVYSATYQYHSCAFLLPFWWAASTEATARVAVSEFARAAATVCATMTARVARVAALELARAAMTARVARVAAMELARAATTARVACVAALELARAAMTACSAATACVARVAVLELARAAAIARVARVAVSELARAAATACATMTARVARVAVSELARAAATARVARVAVSEFARAAATACATMTARVARVAVSELARAAMTACAAMTARAALSDLVRATPSAHVALLGWARAARTARAVKTVDLASLHALCDR